MADGSITLEAIAQFGRLESAFVKQQNLIESLQKQVGRLEAGHSKYERTANRGFDKMIVNAIKVAGTYMTIHKAVQLATSAITDQIEKQQYAAELNRTFQESREAFLTMTGRLSPEQQSRMEQQVLDIGRRRGLDEQMIFPTFTAAWSGTDEADLTKRMSRAVEVFDVSTEMFGRTIQENRVAQGGILQIQRMTESTMEEAAGRVIRFAEQSVATDPASVVGPLTQVISTAISMSGARTPVEKQRVADDATAVLTALSAVGFDPEMAVSRTATINFQAVLQDVLKTGRDAASAVDLIERFVEQGIDPDTIKFQGKAYARKLQPELVRGAASEMADILREQVEVYRQPIGESVKTIKARQQGEEDIGKSLAIATRAAEAGGQAALREEEFVRGSVKEILFGIDQKTGAFSGLGYFDRAGLRAQWWASGPMGGSSYYDRFSELSTGITLLSDTLAERRRAREGLITPDIPGEPFVRTRALLGAPVPEWDPISQNMQRILESLLNSLKALNAEQALQNQIRGEREEQSRREQTDEYRRLTDELLEAAGGQTNPAAAAARSNAEMEN